MNIDTAKKPARPLGLFKQCLKTAVGLAKYLLTGRSALSARMALLDLHCATNGRADLWVSPVIRALRPARAPAAASGILGEFSVARQTAIAEAIARDGFYMFDAKVPSDICDEIEAFASRTPGLIHDTGEAEKPRVVYDPAAPVSKIYRMPEAESIGNRGIQRLIGDPAFLCIAERYLGTLPLLSDVGLWWSLASERWPHQDAAQRFHFDFDAPPVWLKLFIYLTDVGPENGPHTYARGSHRPGNPAMGRLLQRGYSRISDQDIDDAFGKENIVPMLGERGTVFFADTRGFHKGLAPVVGHRLMAVFLYGPPHFNDWVDETKPLKYDLPAEIEPTFAATLAENPRVYQRYRRKLSNDKS
jgi:hypothetical protein